MTLKQRQWLSGLIATLLILNVVGRVHIVLSSDGTRLIRKVHWSLPETLVSLDAITGQPFTEAKRRYPLTIKALQRDGLLETDEQFNVRIAREARDMLIRQTQSPDY